MRENSEKQAPLDRVEPINDAILAVKRANILDRITATLQIAEQMELAESRSAGKYEYCLCGQKTYMPVLKHSGMVYCSLECAEHYRMIGTAFDDGSYFGVAAAQ